MSNKFNFTKSEIDALPIPETGKRDTYHDTKTKGLQLRVTHTGIKTFSVFKRAKRGNPERITLGRYPEMTIDQARRKTMEICLAISEGSNPAEAKRLSNAEMLFDDLFNEYMDRYSKISKKTWKNDISLYNYHISSVLARKKISSITRSDLAYLHSAITKKGSVINANRVLALISSVYSWAIASGIYNSSNPVIGIRRNKEKSRDRFLLGDELPRFFKALAESPNTIFRDYVLISLLTGARQANVLSMRWEDINFDRAEWRIEDTKNGTPQTVALSPEAIEVLNNRAKSGIYVLPGDGGSGHFKSPQRGWKTLLKMSDIKNLRMHDLRRTLGSWQAKTGASLAIIGKSLNHQNQNTTAIYARLDLDPVRASINTATNAMLTAAGLKDTADVIKIKK